MSDSTTAAMDLRTPIERLVVSAFRIPLEERQSDGTYSWDATTVVVAEAEAGGERGIGYSITHAAAAHLISDLLGPTVEGLDAWSPWKALAAMQRKIRNLGRTGICAEAIAAVDTALWDLKARLLGVPLVSLLGPVHDDLPLYGSGGFTSFSVERLREQLGGWTHDGFGAVKMKVGREPEHDLARVQAAREAIGDGVALFVDANGAYDRKEALAFAERYADLGVTWFEEPVSSDDLDGLRLLRDRAPAGMEITAGEYGYDIFYFRRMLAADAVDVLQADITRCQGTSGMLQVAVLCEAHHLPLSSHTAPSLHLHTCCALKPMRHMEYFADHVAAERCLFEGVVEPEAGRLAPDYTRPGNGLTLKRAEAEPYRIFGRS